MHINAMPGQYVRPVTRHGSRPGWQGISRSQVLTASQWTKLTGNALAALRRMASAEGGRSKRSDYPGRYSYLEYSCMSREMDRL